MFADDVCTAVRARSPAKAKGWLARSTERYTLYAGTEVLTILDSVAPEYTQCELLSWTSLVFIQMLVTPEFCRSRSVVATSVPEVTSHV